MNRFRAQSLRVQLMIMGFATALLPILVLIFVVGASSSSEEIISSELAPTGELIETTGRSEPVPVPVPVLIAALALILGVIASVTVWSKQLVSPLRSMAALADEIQVGSLDRRIGLSGQAEEVQTLGDSFDTMLERISKATSVQQQLIEDTSHELRTPLAALAVNNEVILANDDPTLGDYRESTLRSEALISRLQLTIDELLLGARARNQSMRQVDNDLMEIVERVAKQHKALRPDVPLRVVGPASLRLGIDGPSIQRALVNLVENAARFAPAATEVLIEVATEPEVTLSVTDGGPGIDPSEHHLVFDRYFRSSEGDESGDQANHRGIGLALVKQVADAHGHISIESPLVSGQAGTKFTLTFSQS